MAVAVCMLAGLVLLELLSRPRRADDSPAAVFSGMPLTSEQLAAEMGEVADRLLERFPESPQALTLGGSIYYALGDQGAADRCWEKALRIDSHFAPASLRLGEAAWERGEYETAVSHLRRAIDAGRALDSASEFMLADSLMSSGKTAEAIDLLEEAVRERRLSLGGTFLLGHGYLQVGEYQRARDLFEAALRIDPASSRVHFGLATVYGRLGEAEASQRHRQEYAELKSRELDDRSDGRAALRELDLGDLRPLAVTSYLNAGILYASHDDLLQAEKYWRRAVEVDPEHPEAKKWLGVLHPE